MKNKQTKLFTQIHKTIDTLVPNIQNDESSNVPDSLWLDLSDYQSEFSSRLTLHHVKSDYDYEQLFYVLREIQKDLDVSDPAIIKGMVNSTRKFSNRLNSKCYLAKLDNIFIGEIGITPFPSDGEIIGHIKDIHIISQFQRNGFGNELIKLISLKALEDNIILLCLSSPTIDWQKDWFEKLGFTQAV
jgi:N-acetylglutamate synthase-like GNAT family acetyltransferase